MRRGGFGLAAWLLLLLAPGGGALVAPRGVPDATAMVGRRFRHVIPEDAFEGRPQHYTVSEAGKTEGLPPWLHFENGVFEGVPLEGDQGLYVSVETINNPGGPEKDVFRIEVRDNASVDEKEPMWVSLGGSGARETTPRERVRLLESAASLLGIDVGRLHLGATGPDRPLILRAGGEVMETAAADGSLERVLGRPVLGWRRGPRHVPPPKRGTPVPGVRPTLAPDHRVVPTATSPCPPGAPSIVPRHRHRHGEEEEPRRKEEHEMPRPTPALHVFPGTAGATPLPTPVPFPRPGGQPSAALLPSRVTPEDAWDGSTARLEPPSRWLPPPTARPTRPEASTREAAPQSSRAPNFRPTVHRRLKKLSLVCGKAWSYAVPRDTFVDLEDGDTRRLKLMFTSEDRAAVPASSWVQFDPESQLLYALPLPADAGRHEYVLEAMDSEGASAFDRLELHVWPHPLHPSHRFSLGLRYNKWQYPVGVDWQTELLNRLSLFFGDPDASRLVVLAVAVEPARLVWANDSLPARPCPYEALVTMRAALAESDRLPTRELRRLMLPEFRVTDVGLELEGDCEGFATSPPPAPNFAPRLRRPIGRLNLTAGDVLRFRVPDDAFFDLEDGGTRQLRLALETESSNVWLRLQGQELVGVATEPGKWRLRLRAVDSEGLVAQDAFEVVVGRLRRIPSVEFSMRLEHDFETFQAVERSLVAARLARLYGDPDPRHLLVTGVRRGSVVYAWSNKTLPDDRCPAERIDALARVIALPDGAPTPGLVHALRPEFRVTSAHAAPLGVCLAGETPPTFGVPTPPADEDSRPPAPPTVFVEPEDYDDEDQGVFVTTVVPTLAVLALLLLAAGVAGYLLFWRRRKGGDFGDDRDFVGGGGVPVVFAGELEESRPDPGKAPAIMSHERPPLSFPGPWGRRPEPTPQPQQKGRLPPRGAAPYQPPPPFAPGSREAIKRPKTALYRPTTYVPP